MADPGDHSEQLLTRLRQWQRTQHDTQLAMRALRPRTDHPLLRLVAEIIEHDAVRSARVQQMLIDGIQDRSLHLAAGDVGTLAGALEPLIRGQRQLVHDMRKSLDLVRGQGLVAEQYVLEYLMFEEEKHELLLDKLDAIRAGLYPVVE